MHKLFIESSLHLRLRNIDRYQVTHLRQYHMIKVVSRRADFFRQALMQIS